MDGRMDSRRALRSSLSNRLAVPPVKPFTVSSRAFPVAVAQLWNSLLTTCWVIRCQLKHDLFQQSYPDVVL